MAEGLLQHALRGQPEPLKSLKVISAGVAARAGEHVSENSIIALKKVGIDLAGHVAQPLTQKLVEEARAVFCMTESHRAMIELSYDPPPKNLFLLRELMPNVAECEIADPFGGPLRMYEASRDEMVEAIPSILDFLRTITVPSARR
jgi:protein-tyrosine phosphatase